MQSTVVAQSARVRKLFTTNGAAVLLCTSMRTVHMLLHVVQSRESFSADQAHVLSGVHATVVGVLATSEELLSTDGAAVWFLTGVVTAVLQ